MNKILATAALLSPTIVFGAEVSVPDSGGTIGLFALGILLVVAFRRKISK